jgi:epoxyqueuosine reductase QueG
MGELEGQIQDFLRERGVEVAGFAGPERLHGPPSLNPRYTMRGARSIVSMALPMNVEAIYGFLGKKSPVPHNLDQLKQGQRLYRISRELAEYLRSLGHRAQEVPVNNSYRRKINVVRPDPSFSHRFGAIAAGIAGQALSGNVMTEQYGAATYLTTVVTSAKLESSPTYAPDHFMRSYCDQCRICADSCASGMFTADDEEYVLLNGELHPRGERRNLDFCNATCFGLHGISRDRTWSTWGRFWIKRWLDAEPDPANNKKVRKEFLWRGATTGDSTARYDFIRRMFNILWPREEIEDRIPEVEDLPDDPKALEQILWDIEKKMGVDGILGDPNTLTCGQCALICGPTVEETRKRYQMLIDGGIVVPGPEGTMVHVKDFDEAVEYKKQYRPPVTKEQMIADSRASAALWKKLYFGFEPTSALQGWIYDRKLKRAVRSKRRRDPARAARTTIETQPGS